MNTDMSGYGLNGLQDAFPSNPVEITSGDPVLAKLWKIALDDIEKSFCVNTPFGRTFAAGGYGRDFSGLVFSRDTAYSGLLALNSLYPAEMMESLKTIRKCRFRLGFACFKACGCLLENVKGVVCEELSPAEFFKKYQKSSAINKTDDVAWLWCANDLLEKNDFGPDEKNWLYTAGTECFEKLYEPFYDLSDGLYYGQPTFIDVGHSGYPDGWNEPTQENRNRCVWVKATSTNCLYYKGLRVMEASALSLGRAEEAAAWGERADRLKTAILSKLRFPDGAFTYFRHRDGGLEARRDALGSAFAVLCGIVSGEEAAAALKGYPFSVSGVPLLNPFYNRGDGYHNNSAWPFADTFFFMAMEKAYSARFDRLNMLVMLNSIKNGHFREYSDLRSGLIEGSEAQLWTTAAFLNVCMRSGLIDAKRRGH